MSSLTFRLPLDYPTAAQKAKLDLHALDDARFPLTAHLSCHTVSNSHQSSSNTKTTPTTIHCKSSIDTIVDALVEALWQNVLEKVSVDSNGAVLDDLEYKAILLIVDAR